MKHLLLASTVFIAACSAAEPVADAAEPKPAPQQAAAEAPAKPNITSQKLSDSMYMLLGPGGNIGVNIGEDGVYMIDDKFCLLYTSPSPRDQRGSRMPSSA